MKFKCALALFSCDAKNNKTILSSIMFTMTKYLEFFVRARLWQILYFVLLKNM